MLKKYLLLFTLALCALGFDSGSEAAAKKELTGRQERIVTVAALTAQGDLARLKTALNEALDVGMTVNEVKEVLVQLYAYCGFPRSLNGINTLIAVLEERRSAGIVDAIGREATPVDPRRDRYAIGEKTQTELVGRPVVGKTYDFAPIIGVFLKEHLFGDIFERDILNWQERELATVGALAGIGNVNAQLASHMLVSMNTGVTEKQLREVVAVLSERVNFATGKNARRVLTSVLPQEKEMEKVRG